MAKMRKMRLAKKKRADKFGTLKNLLAFRKEAPDPAAQGSRRITLGATLELEEPVRFTDRKGKRFDASATNDLGALFIGPGQDLSVGDEFIVGREMNAGVVFVLGTVMHIEAIGRAKQLHRIRIEWTMFSGTSAALSAEFLKQRLRVTMGDRFQAGAVRTTGAPRRKS